MSRAVLVAVLLLGCGGHGREPAQDGVADAGAPDAGDAGMGWVCYCAGSVAVTCAAGKPICGADDPSDAVAAELDAGTCSCRQVGACAPDQDCIEVHAPQR